MNLCVVEAPFCAASEGEACSARQRVEEVWSERLARAVP
jgi:hypothetical protein